MPREHDHKDEGRSYGAFKRSRDEAQGQNTLMGFLLGLFRSQNTTILQELRIIRRTMEAILATQQQMQDAIARLNTATTAVADRLRRLAEQIENGGMTGEQENAAVAELNTLADSLTSMGQDPADPVPQDPADTTTGGSQP
jgi:hypothetical protein